MRRFSSLAWSWFAFAMCAAVVACRSTHDESSTSPAPLASDAHAEEPKANAAVSEPAPAHGEPAWTGAHELATHVGTYTVRWRSTPDLLPLAQNFALDVWVFAASAPDVPLADVELDVDAGMPQHGHGLARRPRIERVEPGHWRVEGLRFHMPGRWELFFDVTRGARLERAQASVVLE